MLLDWEFWKGFEKVLFEVAFDGKLNTKKMDLQENFTFFLVVCSDRFNGFQ